MQQAELGDAVEAAAAAAATTKDDPSGEDQPSGQDLGIGRIPHGGDGRLQRAESAAAASQDFWTKHHKRILPAAGWCSIGF